MVTLDDIAAAVKARCAASTVFAAALPGGAWLDRALDTVTGDYAIFTLEPEGDAEWFSDGSYLQAYTLRMVAYITQGAVAASTSQAAQLGMADAINANPTVWDALRAGSVNVCLPRAYDGKHEPQLRQGRDVFAAAGQWRMLIEGNRNP